MKYFVLVLLIIFGSCTITPTTDPKELVGIWQDIPEIAAGWSNTYQFFENGRFVYHTSQMVCDKRIIDYSGTWRINKYELILNLFKKTIREGGELVPSKGSCGSEYTIEGGEVKEIKIEKEVSLQLSNITSDMLNKELKLIKFDSVSFWKLESDPAKY